MSILASFSVVFNLWQESRIKIPSCHKGKDDTSLMSTDQTLGFFFFFFKLDHWPKACKLKGKRHHALLHSLSTQSDQSVAVRALFFPSSFVTWCSGFSDHVAPHFNHGWFHSVTAHRFQTFFSGSFASPQRDMRWLRCTGCSAMWSFTHARPTTLCTFSVVQPICQLALASSCLKRSLFEFLSVWPLTEM